jgi:hypothetical protein
MNLKSLSKPLLRLLIAKHLTQAELAAERNDDKGVKYHSECAEKISKELNK